MIQHIIAGPSLRLTAEAASDLIHQRTVDDPGDFLIILDNIDIPESLSPHHPQHGIRLSDTHLKIEAAAGDQDFLPLADDGSIKVIAVLTAAQRQMGLKILYGMIQRCLLHTSTPVSGRPLNRRQSVS